MKICKAFTVNLFTLRKIHAHCTRPATTDGWVRNEPKILFLLNCLMHMFRPMDQRDSLTDGIKHMLGCSSRLHYLLAHRAYNHESSALGKCVRNGPKIQFLPQPLLQLPPLIYQESSCNKGCGKN
jgi:hypothetical protein